MCDTNKASGGVCAAVPNDVYFMWTLLYTHKHTREMHTQVTKISTYINTHTHTDFYGTVYFRSVFRVEINY